MTDPLAGARYGYDRDDLAGVPAPEPAPDFADFWRDLYAAALAVEVAPRRRIQKPPRLRHRQPRPERTTYDITFASAGRVRLGGWLSVPADGPVRRGLVVGHGYGGREAPDPAPPVDDAAVLSYCARGLPDRSLLPDLPADSDGHVLAGIESRETYVHGGCAVDLWCAATALLELVPEAAARLDYVGGSFGGGIGALALPWDGRFTAGCLVVPSFGNHPLRLTLPCTGSGESVRRYAAAHPDVVGVLRYFDAAVAAGFTTIPIQAACALADPAVPPPGQWSIANALAGPREIVELTAGHADYPGMAAENAALLAAQRAFLARTW